MRLNKYPTVSNQIPKELLVLGQGGEITLEEKNYY